MKKIQNYQLLEPPGGQQCRLRFTGTFNNAPVLWNATILTMQEAYNRTMTRLNLENGARLELRQSIEIGAATENGRDITIVLDVPRIDEPTIFKTMVMIHNYKRLRLGRHEYGTPRIIPTQA